MKNFCLRLAIFLILGISVVFLLPQKALAKDSYGFTWTDIATPSAVAVDSLDNVYYAGYAASGSAIEFNPLPAHSPPDIKIATTGGVFLTKVNSGLATYGYSYLIEADDPKVVNGKPTSIMLTKMATDSANNVFLLGSFNGNVNFNATAPGEMDFHDSNGETWQFLTEIMADGAYGQTVFWQSPYITLRDMAFDHNNNIYLAGMATNTTGGDININLDVLTGEEVVQTLNPGDTLAFYTSLVPGTPDVYDYSIFFKNTGSNHLELDHMVLDSTNPDPNVFLFGAFAGTMNFDGTGGTDNKTSNGANDLFLSEYYSNGLYQSTYTIGDTGNESAGTMGIDKEDNIYYTGTFNGTVNFNPTGGTADPQTVGSGIVDQRFLTKLTSDGTDYGYTVTWQTNSLNIEKIAFYDNSLVYLLGKSSGTIDYDPTIGTDTPDVFGGQDAFLTVLNTDGTYGYTYTWGGTGDDTAVDGAFDSFHDLYVAGSTTSLSIDFDPTDITDLPTTFTGGENGYITQFSFVPYVAPSPSPSPTGAPSQNNNSSSNSSSNSSGTPSCGGSRPSAPSIFQIWATKDKATMHFVPSKDTQNTYTVSYGPYSDSEAYSVTFNYSDKSGAIPYTVNALNPGTIYYFKVRANNGCMPGEWSNTLSLKTATSAGVISKTYSNYYGGTSGKNSPGLACTQYTVLPGDSFWSIAQKLLGAGNRYFQLWNANKAKFPSLNSSSLIRTGWTLSVGC